MKVYLCGPINGCTDSECMDWREWFKSNQSLSQFSFVDPMSRDYRGKELDNFCEIVENDKDDILDCDALVVMYDKPSVGTSMEIIFAWEQSKFIYIINNSDGPLSPWLMYHATGIVNSKEEAVEELLSTMESMK